MAGKEFPLSIVIRTVDKATAGIRRISQRVQRLSTRSGLPVFGAAMRDVGGALKGLTLGFGAMAAAAGLGTAAIKGQIDQLDKLAKTADRIGITVDALAELRFAAGQSGTSAEALDKAMEGFSKRLGEARAGTGSLFTFLRKVSPALLRQVKAAKSNEEALGLMADALAKLQDPAKRAALEAAAFGRSGAQLDNLLKTGSAGINALREEYAGLAGSQEKAARASEGINDAMARVTAVFAGVKSGIIEGLAPAFLELAEKAKAFFVENRDRITAFARDFGEKLPKRIEAFLAVLGDVLDVVKPVWNAIGGLRGAAIALGVVLGAKLVFAIKALSLALVTTPFGLIVTAIAGVIAAGVLLVQNWDKVKAFLLRMWERVRPAFMKFFGWVKRIFLNFTPLGRIIKHWGPIKDFFSSLWDGIVAVFDAALEHIRAVIDTVVGLVETVTGAVGTVVDAVGDAGGAVSDFLFGEDEPEAGVARIAERVVSGQAGGITKVFVDFANMPRGARVAQESQGPAAVDLSVGYQLGDTP